MNFKDNIITSAVFIIESVEQSTKLKDTCFHFSHLCYHGCGMTGVLKGHSTTQLSKNSCMMYFEALEELCQVLRK